MKYIITEQQYNLLTEDKILRLDFDTFNNDWDLLQRFLEKKGNPPYKITGNLDLEHSDIKSLGNLQSVGGNLYLYSSNIKSLGNLEFVVRNLDLRHSSIESLENLQSVGGFLDLRFTPLSKTTTEEEIISQVKVGGKIFFR